ncbi:hypothetical protein AK812_SmicGene11051 [Symbiodinium microadriaticum]|uniref:Uncharacterized protein n=1 Tax=Symbiodinium microadriaticum TaxID=2951 RepID=A0A1Q9EE53_SYMMI|nr:hypothetical protein AK812_SmicGene11051 [Symbiodinium microadriaticum]
MARDATMIVITRDAIKTVSWDLDGAEKQLRELALQFSAVNGNIANLDGDPLIPEQGQMEIVTGLIHRMDTMARFLQHVQDPGAQSVSWEPTTRVQTPARAEIPRDVLKMRERVAGAIALPGRFEPQDIRHLAINAAGTHPGSLGVLITHMSSRTGEICLDPLALSVPGWLGPLPVLALAFGDAAGVEEVLGIEGSDILVCLLAGELRLLDPDDGRCAGTVVLEAEALDMIVLEDGRHAALRCPKEVGIVDLWTGRKLPTLPSACERFASPSPRGAVSSGGRRCRLATQGLRDLALWRPGAWEAEQAEAPTPCWSYNFSGARGSDPEAVVALDFEANTLVLAFADRLWVWLSVEDQPGQSPIQISRLHSEPLPLLATAGLVQGDLISAPWLLLWSQTGDVLRCDLGLASPSFVPAGRASVLLALSGLLGAVQATWLLAAWAHLATSLQDPGAMPRGSAEALAPKAVIGRAYVHL